MTFVLEDQELHSLAPIRDYSLTGVNAKVSIDKKLASAQWYTSPIDREVYKQLLERRDGPGIRDTMIWFGVLISSGILGAITWGSCWAIIPFAIYGVFYATTSDSRWHESSHGTAFKTDWMNNVLYEISSFMVFRESTPWRWSHTRHHSDTIIIGRDPEIAHPRPTNLFKIITGFTGIPSSWASFKNMLLHSTGQLSEAEKSYIPESEFGKVYFRARIYIAIYFTVILLACSFKSWLPLMYIGLPTVYGTWLMGIYGYTQHAGLMENVLDHRLNCRTVHMNLINRYLYWNMGYHVEHHMFPMVPYHNLPKLHQLILSDSPKPYGSLWEAWKEIIPALLIQIDNPNYVIKRELPKTAHSSHVVHKIKSYVAKGSENGDHWIEVDAPIPQKEDVIRFDHQGKTYAIYRNSRGELHSTDGMCTHGNTHLADGLVKGDQIECPKHNGRFDIRDGSCKRSPVCVALKTHPVKEENGRLYFKLHAAGGCGAKIEKETRFKVVSNNNVATFIKELVLEPVDASVFKFTPGDYIQLNIPAYENISLSDIVVDERFNKTWNELGIKNGHALNTAKCRRNYSLASNPHKDQHLRFNIRLATAPTNLDCPAGAGSSYVFNLKAGDQVSALGPFGEFHIKNSAKEMIYIGGGAGMAPLRSHLSTLLESERSQRKISFWYGARNLQELFYQDYFDQLAQDNHNFSFHVALSEMKSSESWQGHRGFIHEVLEQKYLCHHPDPKSAEYYLCGPPKMIEALRSILIKYGVPTDAIACDEF